MKQISTHLISSIFKSDLLVFKDILSNQNLQLNINKFYKLVYSIKQLIKILNFTKKLPLLIICQNKQYNILIKKYIITNSDQNLRVFLLSYKVAVSLKMPGIYFIIDCDDSTALCAKIRQQSNSIIYLVEKNYKNKQDLGEYLLDLNIICIKQILFILTVIKKTKNIYENI